MATLGPTMQSYDRFHSNYKDSSEDYKRPPLAQSQEHPDYRIRYPYKNDTYKSPYLSKDGRSLGRSNSCAAENRYNLRNSEKMTDSTGSEYFRSSHEMKNNDIKSSMDNLSQRQYYSSPRKIYSAENTTRNFETDRSSVFNMKKDYYDTKTNTEDHPMPRISSYDNLLTRISEIERQVSKLKGTESNSFKNTKNDEKYSNKYNNPKSTAESYRVHRDPEEKWKTEVERLTLALKTEKDKNEQLRTENDKLRQNLKKYENDFSKLKESNLDEKNNKYFAQPYTSHREYMYTSQPKKTPKKVSFNNSVLEKSSPTWNDPLEQTNQSRYRPLYENKDTEPVPKYDSYKTKPNSFDKNYKNDSLYTKFDDNYKNFEAGEKYGKTKDYDNYKPYYDYENVMKNKDKNLYETSSQFSGCTDAILQSADTILKENNELFSNINKESYFSRPLNSQSYTENTSTKKIGGSAQKKRLMTPRIISDLNLGDIVKFERQDGKFACGTVRYKGSIENKSGNFVGVELDQNNGKNDGSLEKKRYFFCAQNHGLFIQFEKILVCWTD